MTEIELAREAAASLIEEQLQPLRIKEYSDEILSGQKDESFLVRAFLAHGRKIKHEAPSCPYSADDINRMRSALQVLLRPQPMQPCDPSLLAFQVEEQLRTYIVAGVKPAELETQASKTFSALIDR